MGKCLSKMPSQFGCYSCSSCSSQQKKILSESPAVEGVVCSDSKAFMRKYSFSTTNAAYVDFRIPVTAAETVDEQANLPSGCLMLMSSPSSRKVPKDPTAHNPLHLCEEFAGRIEDPDSTPIEGSSTKHSDCSVKRSLSSKESRALSALASPHLNQTPTIPPCKILQSRNIAVPSSPGSKCSSCLFLPRSSIAKKLPETLENSSIQLQATSFVCQPPIASCSVEAEAITIVSSQTGQGHGESATVEKLSDILFNVVRPCFKASLEQEKESQTLSKAESCSICKALHCNCCERVTDPNILAESSEIGMASLSQLSGSQEATSDAPPQLGSYVQQAAVQEEFKDVQPEANKFLIRRSAPSARSNGVYSTEKPSTQMDLFSMKASSSRSLELESAYLAQNVAVSKIRQGSMLNKLSPSRALILGGTFPLATSPTAIKRPAFEPRTRSTESFRSPGRRINATQIRSRNFRWNQDHEACQSLRMKTNR
ncbi:hypothetical protein O6H91_13G039500 [Diphasiastrum complanatum]|uniref:Uncharacterized protein n=2 Tax=Diphasiastrum complanatum TaxID=34168 RepID=A0ACC2BU31_DIPCM|nr:hypothetical protein O6H91_13G039500 [Diphasiastrum complanatum]KAJ7533250.1 hypothetical protein O6H91_13G039500 [Diphasiastrum complanatum]